MSVSASKSLSVPRCSHHSAASAQALFVSLHTPLSAVCLRSAGRSGGPETYRSKWMLGSSHFTLIHLFTFSYCLAGLKAVIGRSLSGTMQRFGVRVTHWQSSSVQTGSRLFLTSLCGLLLPSLRDPTSSGCCFGSFRFLI